MDIRARSLFGSGLPVPSSTVGKSSRGKLRSTLLTQRFRVQTSGEHSVGHASPTIFSCSGFYLVMAPIHACHVAAPPEAI